MKTYGLRGTSLSDTKTSVVLPEGDHPVRIDSVDGPRDGVLTLHITIADKVKETARVYLSNAKQMEALLSGAGVSDYSQLPGKTTKAHVVLKKGYSKTFHNIAYWIGNTNGSKTTTHKKQLEEGDYDMGIVDVQVMDDRLRLTVLICGDCRQGHIDVYFDNRARLSDLLLSTGAVDHSDCYLIDSYDELRGRRARGHVVPRRTQYGTQYNISKFDPNGPKEEPALKEEDRTTSAVPAPSYGLDDADDTEAYAELQEQWEADLRAQQKADYEDMVNCLTWNEGGGF